jgi:hypothetical protein
LIVLAAPFVLYSLASALVPGDHDAVESWRDHFYRVRTRFFVLYACFWVVVGLANLFVLGQPFLNVLRLFQMTFIVLYGIGAVSKRPSFHPCFSGGCQRRDDRIQRGIPIPRPGSAHPMTAWAAV